VRRVFEFYDAVLENVSGGSFSVCSENSTAVLDNPISTNVEARQQVPGMMGCTGIRLIDERTNAVRGQFLSGWPPQTKTKELVLVLSRAGLGFGRVR
jgi:hypothetical protein